MITQFIALFILQLYNCCYTLIKMWHTFEYMYTLIQSYKVL